MSFNIQRYLMTKLCSPLNDLDDKNAITTYRYLITIM